MINVSNAFREKLEAGEPVRMMVDITFPDGTKKTIDEEIMNGDNGFTDCAESSSFPIGTSVCKTLTLNINNYEEQWKEYDFYSAKIHAYLKINSLAEKIDKGIYTVTTPEQYSDIITITALDDMYKANKAYTSGLKLPQSFINLVRDACETIGIGMNLTMEHGDIIIRSIPDNMTFRQLFGYAAMVESANARIDYSGNLQFVKWDFENSDIPDLKEYGNPPTLSSDDIVITGIKVKNGQSDDDTDAEYSGMYGEEGYVLELENELIDSDQLETIANIIGEQIVGAIFRNLEGDLAYNPLVEFGDMAYTYDRIGNKYLTPLTDVSGNVGGMTTVKTQADDPIRGSSDYYSEKTKTIVAARQIVKKETSAREEAVKRLEQKISDTNASGMFCTDVKQEDGSTIRYLHDKPTLKESSNVIKVTSEAIGISNDGGKTYPYGITLDGETITRILYAEGINADYINAGTLIVKDKNNKVIFEADIGTGSVTLDGSCVTIGGKTLDEKIEGIENAAALARNMTMQLDNDYQGIPVDSDGNYSTFPDCTTTATVMYGSQDITDDCTYTITKSENVQGRWKDDTHTYTVTALTADSGWVDIRAAYLNNLVISKRFSLAKQYAGKNGIDGLQGIQGEKGEQGIPGKDGTNGTDGKTSYFHIKYSSVSNPTSSSQMTEAPSAYIGTYVDFTEADSNDPKKYTWSKFEGKDGEDGIPGANGADGKTYYLHIAYANSADGKTDFSTSNSTNKSYIGQYTDTTQADSTDPTKYSWTKIKGETGASGRTYFIELSSGAAKRGADGSISPSSVTAYAYYRDGTNSTRTAYSGRWKIQTSTDGNTWSDAWTSTSNSTSVTRTLAKTEKYNFVRFVLYAAGGTTNMLDMQTLVILTDISALTQEEIVNILSNNGTWKGLYYLNNHLYISFDAAKGGTVILGGANNGNGQLKLYDGNGNEVLRLNNGGMAMNSASDDAITIFRLLRTGLFYYDSTGTKRKVSIDTGGLAVYVDYTDANNYKMLKLGKYGLYAAKKTSGVEELWMEGDTSHKWDGYIIRYLNDLVRITANAVYTDGSSMGDNLATSGTLSVAKTAGLKGGAYVQGSFSFEDAEQTTASSPVRRRPIATAGTEGKKIAYIASGTTMSSDGFEVDHLEIRGQFATKSYYTRKFYSGSAPSDIRLKENIEDSEVNALELVNRMQVRQFDWKKGGHQNIGFVADELEKIDPKLALGGGYDENGKMDVKQINSPYLLNYAIKAIQELNAKVDEQEKRIKKLERRLQ